MDTIWHGSLSRASERRRALGSALAKILRSVTGIVLIATSITVVPVPSAYAATPGYYIAGDGSGGGASGDYWSDYGATPDGGAGGGNADTIAGTSGDDVIFGDGSGGGGGGSIFRNGSGGAGGSGADTIDGDAGNDIIFGDGFTGMNRSTYNGGAGGFGGGGGGGGSYSTNGNGGAGGLLAGGGGAQSNTTPGSSIYGGYSGGAASKPSGGSATSDNMWGGNSALPAGGSGWFTDQSLGGSANNCYGAGGGAGIGGGNTRMEYTGSAWYYCNGGWGQGGDGEAGSTTPVHWSDSAGALWSYVYGQRASIFSSASGTTNGVGSGTDTIDGGPGSDELFGLGGNDTFVFERNEAGASDADTIRDFDRLSEADRLSLYISGTLISVSTRNALIAAQTTSGSDRSIVFTDGDSHSVTITVKSLGRDLATTDFNATTIDPPTVATTGVSDITSTTATGGGNVTSQGGDTVTARGMCWGTSANPTTGDSHTTNGSGTGSFTGSITGLSGNTRYHARAYATNSGGTSYGSDVVFYFDNGAPTTTASGLAASAGTSWLTATPTVSFSATDTLSGVANTQYAVDGGGWNTYGAPVGIGGSDGSHPVTYRSTDTSGNVEGTHTGYVNLDRGAPSLVVTSSPSGWQTTVPVTIGASAEDALSGLAGIRYSTNGGAVATYSASIGVSAEGTTTLAFDALDLLGNRSATQTAVVKIDSMSPTTTATGLASAADEGWRTTSPWAFSLEATDAGSGVAATTYTVDSGAGQLYTGSVLVGGEGSHVVMYNSEDAVGHVETTHTGYVNIDTHAPTTTLFGATDMAWRTSDATITLTATDTVSGVGHSYYALNAGAVVTYAAPFQITNEGTTTVAFMSADEAGNAETTNTVTVLVDKTAPTSKATAPTGWVGTPATVTITASDTVSGVAHAYYEINGGTTRTYAGPISVTDEGTTTVSYWSVDTAGNVETTKTITVRASGGPVTTITTPVGWVNTDATVTIEATSPLGVADLSYRVGSGADTSYTAPFAIGDEGTTLISACSTDTNGACRGETTATVRVDKTAPVTTDDHVGIYSRSATLHLAAVDALSGVAFTRYVLDSGTPTTGTVVTCSSAGMHTLQYLSTDVAGNVEATRAVQFTVGLPVLPTRMRVRGASRIHMTGHRYTLTTLVYPRSASGRILITMQRDTGDAWVTVKRATSAVTHGKSVYRFRPGRYGHWRLFVHYQKTRTATAVYLSSRASKRFWVGIQHGPL